MELTIIIAFTFIVLLHLNCKQMTVLQKQIAQLTKEAETKDKTIADLQALMADMFSHIYKTKSVDVVSIDEKETLDGSYDDDFISKTKRSDPPK